MEYLESGANVGVVYLDFVKGFDKVDHQIAFSKLTGHVHGFFEVFLCERTQNVCANGRTSKPWHVVSGVPQGSVLGPLIFLVMLCDINEDLIYSSLSSFADDSRDQTDLPSP